MRIHFYFVSYHLKSACGFIFMLFWEISKHHFFLLLREGAEKFSPKFRLRSWTESKTFLALLKDVTWKIFSCFRGRKNQMIILLDCLGKASNSYPSPLPLSLIFRLQIWTESGVFLPLLKDNNIFSDDSRDEVIMWLYWLFRDDTKTFTPIFRLPIKPDQLFSHSLKIIVSMSTDVSKFKKGSRIPWTAWLKRQKLPLIRSVITTRTGCI